MRKLFYMISIIGLLSVFVACGNNDEAEAEGTEEEELQELIVEFDVPKTAKVDETIELKATVTYGDEDVTNAEVAFEYWELGNKDDSTNIDAVNNDDGTYTAEITFEDDGAFEMYAHTDARNLHTMPKEMITVGDPDVDEHAEEDDHEHEHGHYHTEGFDMHFMDLENVQTAEEIDVVTHLLMEESPFEDADVRYEIWNEEVSDKHEWVDAQESEEGEYIGTHTFPEAGTYNIMIHVEDDDGLHEHEEHEIEVE